MVLASGSALSLARLVLARASDLRVGPARQPCASAPLFGLRPGSVDVFGPFDVQDIWHGAVFRDDLGTNFFARIGVSGPDIWSIGLTAILSAPISGFCRYILGV